MMVAFEVGFGEEAKRDGLVLRIAAARGKAKDVVFREFYCAEPGCDCRAAVFQAMVGERIEATINYDFDAPPDARTSLDLFSPQGRDAATILDLFDDHRRADRRYEAMLRRHLAHMKAALADPQHPAHARIVAEVETFWPTGRTKATRTNPSAPAEAPRTKAPRSKPPRASEAIERVTAKVAGEGKAQQQFRRLLAKVEGLKGRVRAWHDRRPDIARGMASQGAALARRDTARRALALVLDGALGQAKLNRLEHRFVVELVGDLAGELLARGGHDDLKDLYQRHTQRDFDRDVAEDEAAALRELQDMLEVMGVDLGGEVASLDELQARAQAHVEEFERQRAELGERKRRPSKRQAAAAQARAEERANVDKALQEVYRQLARAHHPDRELDPVERARKTELMREVNLAYEAKDLLRLLELQLALEGVTTAAGTIAEERLRHYVLLLGDQCKRLEQEAFELEQPFRIELGLSPQAKLTPERVLAALANGFEELEAQRRQAEADATLLADVRRLRPWIRERRRAEYRAREGLDPSW